MGNNNRVGRMKLVLLFAPYILILLSVVISGILIYVVNRQHKQISEMEQELAIITDNQSSVTQTIKEVSDSSNALRQDVESLAEDFSKINLAASVSTGTNTDNVNMWPKKVYLTFDDGPSVNTGRILDILDSYGIKGNFFVVGTDSENLKKMYKRIIDEGHVLGMHSYSHKYSEIYASKDSFIRDLDRISDLVFEETGTRPRIYRFPGGSSNNVSRVPMKELMAVLEERGITYYDWNVLSGDATNPALPTQDIINNSLDNIGYYEEAMILFHDLSNKTTTVEALPQIIEALLERGITIAPIDENTMLIQHNKNTN